MGLKTAPGEITPAVPDIPPGSAEHRGYGFVHRALRRRIASPSALRGPTVGCMSLLRGAPWLLRAAPRRLQGRNPALGAARIVSGRWRRDRAASHRARVSVSFCGAFFCGVSVAWVAAPPLGAWGLRLSRPRSGPRRRRSSRRRRAGIRTGLRHKAGSTRRSTACHHPRLRQRGRT